MARWHGMVATTLALCAASSASGTARAEPDDRGGDIIGVVRERGTRAPVGGIPVLLRGPAGFEAEALSDDGGRFAFEAAPAGLLTLDVFTGGYEPLLLRVHARPTPALAEARPVFLYLRPSGLSAYRTVVAEPRVPKAATVVTLAAPELRQVAGTFGDPTRVVGALPGVGRPLLGLGDMVVRGAGPEHTGYFIDGHPTRFLYHLLGGPGVVDPALVGDLAFYPGGYPASLGRVASAAVAVTTADLLSDRWHLDVHLDLLKAGALFTAPFDDGRGVVALSFRRSYFDLFLPLVDDGLALAYTDYRAQLSHQLSPAVRARLSVLGAEDHAGFAEGEGDRREIVDVTLGFHRVDLAIEVDLSPCLRWVTRAAGDYERARNLVTEPGSPDLRADDDRFALHALSTFQWRPRRGFSLTSGVDLLWRDSLLDRALPTGDPLGEPTPVVTDWVVVAARRRAHYVGFAPFVEGELKVAPELVVVPGVRLGIDRYGSVWSVYADPKLALRWTFAPEWTLSAMGALAHQPPPAELTATPLGEPDLAPTAALQTSLGLEWAPPGWTFSLTGFYQVLSGLAHATTYTRDDGEGRAYGGELMLRKRLGERVHGWLSYTLGRAERRLPPDGWRLYERDQTHVLNLATTFLLGAEWSLGVRFQLASGDPYRAVVGADYDADGDRYLPRYAAATTRMRVYHRLDLRLDKTWRFERWLLQVYLDVQNVYAAENPETLVYAYDYSRSRGGFSLPVLPALGMRMVF